MTNIAADAALENYLCLYVYKTDSSIVETMATCPLPLAAIYAMSPTRWQDA